MENKGRLLAQEGRDNSQEGDGTGLMRLVGRVEQACDDDDGRRLGYDEGRCSITRRSPSWWLMSQLHRTAISMRIGRPSKVPQLTPAPFAITSENSTERPTEKY